MVAVSFQDGQIHVLLGDGARGYVSTGDSYYAGEGACSLVASDFDEDGQTDLAVAGRYVWVHLGRGLHPIRCRRGNVNHGGAAPADVLTVNGSSGGDAKRTVSVDSHEPFEIFMDAPPSLAHVRAKFALYASIGFPDSPSQVRQLPHDLGPFCMPTVLTDGDPAGLERIWNNIGKYPLLGEPDLPSVPAPSVVFSKPAGIGRTITFFLQGIILDPGSPCGIAAVTNGIVVVSRDGKD
jgi:hypothetical protein